MRRNILFLIVILCVLVCLSNCAGPATKERPLVFKDPDAEKQAEYLQQKLKTDPNDAESRMELGRIFLSESMPGKAINQFEQVLNIEHNHIQAHLLLSLALQKFPNPNLSQAAKLLENASELARDNADVRLNLAQIYDKLKKDDKAISEFKKTIELSDEPATLVSAHLGLMAIYKKQGELEKANEQYDAAYKIYPGVEEMIKQVEINRITPAPKYAGEEFRDGEGLHPTLEKRIKRAREEILKISGEKNE